MNSIFFIVSIFFFFLSVSGYALYIYKKTKIRLEFIPIIIFSSIICIINLTGLLNIMQYTTYAIFLFGLGLFVFFLVKKQLPRVFNKSNLTIGAVFIFLAVCCFVILLRDAKFSNNDNFSLWGIVVKEMLIFNRLPNPESVVISYRTYPLGSSLFIYYVSKIIGATESRMIIAQIILMLACIFALFGIIKNNKSYFAGIITVCATIYMIKGYLSFDNLLVDTLLPLVGIAATAIIFYYRNDVKRASMLALPVMIATLLMKSSGIFFVIINCLFLLYIAVKAKKTGINKREIAINFAYVFGIIFVTFFMLFLWNKHIDYVFPGVESNNTMSIDNFSSVFGSKTSHEITEVITNFVKKLLNVKTTSTKTMLLANISTVALIIIIKLAYKKNMRGIINGIICADVLFLIYQASILGTYLFYMSTNAALGLASYDRYSSSIIVYILGILVIGFIYDYERFFDIQRLEISDKKANRIFMIKKVIFVVMMLISILVVGSTSISNNYKDFFRFSKYENSVQYKIERLVGDNWSGYSSKKYLIYAYDKTDHTTNSYIQRVATYITFSKEIEVINTIEPKSFIETLSKYDYLIILNEDETLSEFMSRYINKSKYFGIYPIHETFFNNN